MQFVRMSEIQHPTTGQDTLPPHWPLVEHSRNCQVAGTLWHYQRINDASIQATPCTYPKLLMIHGTGASTHSWAPLVTQLRGQWDCLLIDLPGHGFSSPLAGQPPTLPAVASALAKLVDALEFQPDVIVGHSAGAAIAVQMALTGINSRALVSINGAFLPFGSLAAPLFSKAAGWLAKARLFQQTTALHGYFRRPITKLLAETGSHPNEQMIRAYQVLMRRADHIRGTLEMMAAWDLEALKAQLPTLHTPIELMVCCNDKTVSPWQSIRLSELVSTARLTELDHLGHLGHEERPDQFLPVFHRLWAASQKVVSDAR